MKIMITGGLGHIGSKLIRTLSMDEIVVVDNLRTQRFCSLFSLPNNIKFIEKDINNLSNDDLKDIDIVIHLAAVVDAAGADPKGIEEVNVKQTKEFIDQCISMKVPKFIFPSSTSIYGTNSNKVYEDDKFINPQSVYAESKVTIEEYLKVSDINYLIFRFGTIFGISPGMRFHTAVNRFCWDASLNRPLNIWKENYDQLRPYLDINDAINCIQHFIDCPEYINDTFNIVTDNYTASYVVDMIEHYIGPVKLNMVDSPLLNQYSYEVSAYKAYKAGYSANGNLMLGISDTLELLKGLT